MRETPEQLLKWLSSAFIGAGLTSVATSIAFTDLGELVAFFLAIVANHLDGFSKMAGMLGIDRRKRV